MSLLMQALKKAEQSRAEAAANSASLENPAEVSVGIVETHQFHASPKVELALTDFPSLALEEMQITSISDAEIGIETNQDRHVQGLPNSIPDLSPELVPELSPELNLESSRDANPEPAPISASPNPKLAAMQALGALQARHTPVQAVQEEPDLAADLGLDFAATNSPARQNTTAGYASDEGQKDIPFAPPPIPRTSSASAAPTSETNPGRAASESASPTAGPAQARALFSAKQKQSPGSRRILLIGLLGSLPLMVLGAYFYLQLATTNPNSVLNVPPVAPGQAPVTPLASAVPAVVAPGVPATVLPSASPQVAPTNPSPTLPATAEAKTLVSAAPADPNPSPNVGAPRPASRVQPGGQAASEIKLLRSNPALQIAPGLQQAYQAYQRGDDASAERLYREVLQREPQNRDAILGAAALALRQNQVDRASQLYLQLLEQDPQDPDASAALLSLQQADPQQAESRLKKLLQQQPQSAPLHFVLGNVYARQQRWAEAQQSFFNAFTAAPNNPDYLFNLALSLDRLTQPRLALDYYQRALVLAQTSPVNFSVTAVQQRIQQLQTTSNDGK